MFHVLILSSRPKGKDAVLFEGQSSTVSLPGKDGEFEILDFHKPILSRMFDALRFAVCNPRALRSLATCAGGHSMARGDNVAIIACRRRLHCRVVCHAWALANSTPFFRKRRTFQ